MGNELFDFWSYGSVIHAQKYTQNVPFVITNKFCYRFGIQNSKHESVKRFEKTAKIISAKIKIDYPTCLFI
jgi:hypothetical protein